MGTKKQTGKSLQYYMRMIHRVLGYLAVGMVIVYALSGITLIHRTNNFMKRGTHVEQTFAPDLNSDQLASALKVKSLKVTDETDQTIYFADGQYDKATGKATYIKREVVSPLNSFIDLHKLPDAKNPPVAAVTTMFSIVLFLLAVTSLFMYKPSAKQFKTNMLYTAIGVAVVIILLLAI